MVISIAQGVSISLFSLHPALRLLALGVRAVADLGLRHQTDDLVGVCLEDKNHLNA